MKVKLFCALAVALLFSACSAPKDITYMQGFENRQSCKVLTPKHLTIQPNDRLSIVVSSRDPELAVVFNLAVAQSRIGNSSTGASNLSTAAFTVDPYGEVDYPLLGKLKIAGLTRPEASELIQNAIKKAELLKDPIVTVEFLNATISVLGDVSNPGVYNIDRDDMTLLQAIGKAGDLAITGQRENVLLVRRDGDKEVAYRVNLTDTYDILNSPAYYVQQNDIIYVEPNNKKKREANANGNTALTAPFWISVASFLTTIVVLIFK